jgi:hypothetical protein
MALSNSERQARLRERRQQRLDECITPADVDRAVRMLYEACRYESPDIPEWEVWIDDLCQRSPAKATGSWSQMVPDSGDPDNYHDHLSEEDRQFLAKVGAVISAARYPAGHR